MLKFTVPLESPLQETFVAERDIPKLGAGKISTLSITKQVELSVTETTYLPGDNFSMHRGKNYQ